ncbi:MAG: PIN domain-containing protein [Limisphaerales bacterium]|jgi:predicted nucleic acid-binding protein
MPEPAFFDTNLFLYAYSRAREDRPKRDRARALFEEYQPVVSIQVIQEFTASALRKPTLGIHEDKIDEFLSLCADHSIQPITLETLLLATALRRRFSLSHWDSTILAAAQESGCRKLFSEDLQHGFRLQQLTVRNPFL